MEAQLNPYLTFNGTAAPAMKFYQSVFGGELTMQTFGEVKMAQGPADENLIMHASLKSDSAVIMASDSQAGEPAKAGDNIRLSLSGKDEKGLTDVFNKLAEGGTVDLPMAKQFWGDTFGMVTDKFGTQWMVNIAKE
ncbi:MAG TPA: VOC family protein [Nitrososphaerales archaeon]|nr:VOC family protein [Nitrososphaerales archaeon]